MRPGKDFFVGEKAQLAHFGFHGINIFFAFGYSVGLVLAREQVLATSGSRHIAKVVFDGIQDGKVAHAAVIGELSEGRGRIGLDQPLEAVMNLGTRIFLLLALCWALLVLPSLSKAFTMV